MKKTEKELLQWAKNKFGDAVRGAKKFRKDARIAFRFYGNDQWDKETLRELGERPALSFNLIKPAVDLLLGMQDQNVYTVKAAPQDVGSDPFLCDVLNKAKDKIYSLKKVQYLENEVWEHGAICGRGFCAVDVKLDAKRVPFIDIDFEVIPYQEVFLDPSAQRADYSDAAFIAWRKWLSVEDFKKSYPEHAKEAQNFVNIAKRSSDLDDDGLMTESDEAFMDFPAENYADPIYYDSVNDRIAVVHMEYWVNYDRYYGINPMTGKLEQFKEENLPALKQFIKNFQYIKVPDKKLKWLQFTGNTILFNDDNPLPFDDFSITPFFFYTDRSDPDVVNHFGIVKPLIDPQKEVNKRWSQALNLLLSQSQGGYFAEVDVPADDRQWEDTIDEPGATTFVSKGALSQGKIQPKRMPDVPQAAIVFEEKAQQIIHKIIGIDPDLLQVSPTTPQSGVLYRFKQLQALSIFRKPFANFNLFKEKLAEKVFKIIVSDMPDEQIEMILGEGSDYVIKNGMIGDKTNNRLIPLRDLKNLEYNIVSMPAPDAPVKKAYELAVLLQMLQYKFPVDPTVIISKLDISEKDKQKWIQFIQQQQQAAAQQQQLMMQQNIQKEQTEQQLKQAKLQLKAQSDMARLSQKEKEAIMNYAIAIANLKQEDKKLVADLITKLMALQQQRPQKLNLNMPPSIRGAIGNVVPGVGNG